MVGNLISGGDVVRQLEHARRDARRREAALRANLDKLDDFMEEMIERRGQSLIELSQHYFPDLSPSTVDGQFVEVRDSLRDLLRRKQRHEAELERWWDASLDSSAKLERQLETLTDELNELAAKRDELERLLADRLRSEAEFQQLSEEALAAESELKRNELRVAEMREEVAEKLPAYEKSKLFKYLHRRGYGTHQYRGSGLTKRLDGWVAKVVNYDKNRQSYDFLRVTPELMAAEVERRQGSFNSLMQRLEGIEDRISDEIGLTEVMTQGNAVGKRREGLLDEMKQLEEARARTEQEMARLETTENEYYTAGVERLKDFLSALEESALERRTRATPETADDAIFREVQDCNRRLREARDQSRDDRRLVEVWKEKISGLDQVVRRFRSSQFESRRSWFSPRLSIDREVDRYLEGRNTAAGLWSVIRRYQQFVRPEFDDSWDGMGGMWDSDVSHVLGRVLLEVAGEAMRQAAQRGMHRRGPTRQQGRRSSGRPPYRPGGGFTSGRGF